MRRTSPLPFVALFGLFAAVLAPLALGDEIYFTDGSVQKDCKVTDESLKQVRFTIKAGDKDIVQTRPGKEVDRIVYASQPAALAQGKAALEAGDYDGAITHFNNAAARSEAAWVKQHAGYYLGEALLGKRDADGANRAFEALITAFPETRFRAEARLGQVRALELKGDMPGAQAALTRVEAEIKERDMGPAFDLKAKLEGARIAEAMNDWRGALDKYTHIIGAAEPFPAVMTEARIGLAKACVETNDVARATTEIRNAIAPDNLPDPIAARAYMILGDCQKKANKPRDAFFAYLRVIVLYSGLTTETPRAYYEAAKIVKTMPDLGGEPRAKELNEELKSRYPRSEWATKP
jgi:TolA-binding protein